MGSSKTFPDSSTDGLGTIYGENLKANALKLTNSATTMEVVLRDHGMYDTSNNVDIRGAVIRNKYNFEWCINC